MALRDDINPLVDELLRLVDETPAAQQPISGNDTTSTMAALRLAIAVVKYRPFQTPPNAAVLKNLRTDLRMLKYATDYMRDRHEDAMEDAAREQAKGDAKL